MDPEMKSIANGGTMARFSLATNESYKNAKGEKIQETQWHTLVAWNKTAELVEKLLKKGKEVAIEGKIVNRSYEDKDGIKRYATDIRLEQFMLLGKKQD
jgi:single-strand DNA-binding protein